MSVVEQRQINARPGAIRWTASVLVAGLLVLFTMTVSVSSADASCGDYLHHRGLSERRFHAKGQQAESLHADSRILIASSESEQRDHLLPLPNDPDSPIPPCSGPFCQQAPRFPADRPQTDLQNLTIEELCLGKESRIDSIEDWSALVPTSDRSPHSPDSARLDRPPQSV